MKQSIIFICLSLLYLPASALTCPNDKQYHEMISTGNPTDDQERQSLTNKFSNELLKKYPGSSVKCDIKDEKYFYCFSCPQ